MINFGDCPRYMIELMSKCDFDEMFEIMRQSFPEDEYREREKQLELFDDENYGVFCSRTEDRKISAIMAAWKIEGGYFLENFAVRKDLRGNGLGGAFLDELTNMLDGIICLEVELPENDICRRRIAFYERHSFCLNDYEYYLPPLTEGNEPKKLLLMTYKEPQTKEKLDKIKRAIHLTAYKTDKYL